MLFRSCFRKQSHLSFALGTRLKLNVKGRCPVHHIIMYISGPLSVQYEFEGVVGQTVGIKVFARNRYVQQRAAQPSSTNEKRKVGEKSRILILFLLCLFFWHTNTARLFADNVTRFQLIVVCCILLSRFHLVLLVATSLWHLVTRSLSLGLVL